MVLLKIVTYGGGIFLMQDKYKYTDVSERNRRMNRFYIVATSLLGLMFLFYLWMKQFNHNIPSVVVYCNTALIAVFAAVNVIVYRKNTATRYLKVMSTIEIGIEYLLIGVQTDASFISYAILGIFILQIPYYEKKSLKRTAAGMLILYIIVTAVQASKGIYGQDVNAVCSIFMIVLIGVVILEVGKLTILFNDDAGKISCEIETDSRPLSLLKFLTALWAILKIFCCLIPTVIAMFIVIPIGHF